MRSKLFLALYALCLAAGAGILYADNRNSGDDGFVAVLKIDGAISPATSDYFSSMHSRAVEDGARAVVLTMDTPGGLETAMRDMIRTIMNSSVPVITWVSPEGARAASAGTYILYASHVAAMAPATNLGAATPVQIGGAPEQDDPRERGRDDKDRDESDDDADADDAAAESDEREEQKAPEGASAAEKKAINDAVAYIRSLAEKRGRNADWAERAVREGVSLSSGDAVERNVIDFVATSMSDLLEQSEGREVEVAGGAVATISVVDLEIRHYEPGWRYEFLSIITNPTIAYVLMMIGIYGLLLEGYSPGAILPGTIGAISLLLALYAFQLMPVNYVGLLLIVLGIVLMIAEALAPSFGVLGFGGVAAFILGSVLLMDTDVPGYGVNLGLIVGIAVVSVVILGVTLYMLFKSRRARIVTGEEGTIDGRIAVVSSFSGNEGWVRVNGELWRAQCGEPLAAGDQVRVLRHDGLRFVVEPLRDGPSGGSTTTTVSQS